MDITPEEIQLLLTISLIRGIAKKYEDSDAKPSIESIADYAKMYYNGSTIHM